MSFRKEEADVFVPLLEQGEDFRGDLSRKGFLYDLDENVYAWPYYCNLLLVAYRQDWFVERRARGAIDKGDAPKGVWRPKSWKSIWKALSSPNPPVGLSRLFWYDRKAGETLACMLMERIDRGPDVAQDGLVDREAALTGLLRRPQDSKLSTAEIDELVALSRLLGSSREAVFAASTNGSSGIGGAHTMDGGDRERASGAHPLTADGMVYVCWYSQLRELIDRVPSQAPRLRVCALPGGGFRGDWYMGILRGSVSPELGREVVAKLSRRDEEYKRFALGVGLPVSEDFANPINDYFAWPGAVDPKSRRMSVPAWRVFDIHQRAWSRSDIERYTQIRSNLSKIGQQLGALDAVDAADDDKVRAFVGLVAGAKNVQPDSELGEDRPKPAR